MGSELVLASLGHFILDELVHQDADGVVTKKQTVSGGGGLYAILACRLWLPAEKLALTVRKGFDFPVDVEKQLESYGECWKWIDGPHRRTFRARTTIRGSTRTFQALTERFWDTPNTLHQSGLPAPQYLHLVCSPQQALETVQDLNHQGGPWTRTKIVYEPMPYECKAENWAPLQAVLPFIEVFSPNDAEAARLLSVHLANEHETAGYKSKFEMMLSSFLEHMSGPAAAILRCGANGACIGQKGIEGTTWVPAYFGEGDQSRIVDVTGAGNAFLGGLVAGLAAGVGPVEACMYGSVSSSYMLEQFGPPALMFKDGDTPVDRLERLKSRVARASLA